MISFVCCAASISVKLEGRVPWGSVRTKGPSNSVTIRQFGSLAVVEVEEGQWFSPLGRPSAVCGSTTTLPPVFIVHCSRMKNFLGMRCFYGC